MSQTATKIQVSDPSLEIAVARRFSPPATARRIVFRSAGRRHGPITRLVSPSDVGEMIKPFVFLDHAEVAFTGEPLAGIHPHSGIATLTTVLQGGLAYEDTTGKEGQVRQGGLEWMKAGKGVWHDGGPLEGDPLRVFQLWIALPEQEELAPPESQYVPTDAVEEDGPVRVILGQYGVARSRIRAPEGINYFHVRLKDSERWVYSPPHDHNVAWLAVDQRPIDCVGGCRERTGRGLRGIQRRHRVACRGRHVLRNWVCDQASASAGPWVLLGPHERVCTCARRDGDQAHRVAAERGRPTLKRHQSSTRLSKGDIHMSTHSLADPQVPVSTNRTSAPKAFQKRVGARRPTVSFGALFGFRPGQTHRVCGNGCLHVCAWRARRLASVGDRHRDRWRGCDHRRLENPPRCFSAGWLFATDSGSFPQQFQRPDRDGHVPQERVDRRRIALARGEWRWRSQPRSTCR